MTKGGGTELDTAAVNFTGSQLLEAILPTSIVRRVMPVFTVLPIEDQNYTYWELLNDIGTKYDFDPYEYGSNANALKETTVPIPLIYHEQTYDKFKLKRINKSKAPLADRTRQMARVFNRDENNLGLAGETTKTGVTSFADTTNNSIAAAVGAAELDLTSFTTMKATLNDLISELSNNLSGDSSASTVKDFPCMVVMTSDVEKRLWTMISTLDDKISGWDLFEQMIMKRCGAGTEILVNNALGGTVTTVDDRVKLSTPGTINFMIHAKSANHGGFVASTIFTESETTLKGFTKEIAERWRPIFFRQEATIYSGTVDITA